MLFNDTNNHFDKDKKLFLVLGSPGGSTIITTVAQVAMNVIDFGMTIEEAVESKESIINGCLILYMLNPIVF